MAFATQLLRRIKPTLKLPGCQEAQPFMRTLVLVLENPLVDYLLHLSRTHRLVVVVKALGLQRAYEPFYERLVLRPVRPAIKDSPNFEIQYFYKQFMPMPVFLLLQVRHHLA